MLTRKERKRGDARCHRLGVHKGNKRRDRQRRRVQGDEPYLNCAAARPSACPWCPALQIMMPSARGTQGKQTMGQATPQGVRLTLPQLRCCCPPRRLPPVSRLVDKRPCGPRADLHPRCPVSQGGEPPHTRDALPTSRAGLRVALCREEESCPTSRLAWQGGDDAEIFVRLAPRGYSSFIYATCVTETAPYEQNGVPA